MKLSNFVSTMALLISLLISFSATANQANAVYDSVTNLVWDVGSGSSVFYDEAQAYCQSKNDDGLQWRLPTIEEFLSAFNPNRFDKYHNDKIVQALHMGLGCSWSSSPYVPPTDTIAIENAISLFCDSGLFAGRSLRDGVKFKANCVGH